MGLRSFLLRKSRFFQQVRECQVPQVALCVVPVALGAGHIAASCTRWGRWAQLWQQQQILLVTTSLGALAIMG